MRADDIDIQLHRVGIVTKYLRMAVIYPENIKLNILVRIYLNVSVYSARSEQK